MHIKPDIQSIQRIVGSVTEEQLRFIDSFTYKEIGIFLPIAGQCQYSITPEHTHPSYMIIYSFKGESEGWVKGIKQDALKAGEFLFMSPNIKHQEVEGSETPTYLALLILPELFNSIAEEYQLSEKTLQTTITLEKAAKQLLPLCWQFISEASSSTKTNNSLLDAISTQLCHCIIRSVFKKEMGQTPMDYLSEQRLYKAQNMLVSGEFSMQDIAGSCGFSSVSYLSTSFKKRYLISPEKFKMRIKVTE